MPRLFNDNARARKYSYRIFPHYSFEKFIASLVVNVLCANTKQIWLKFMCMKCISYLRARDH